MSLETSLTEKLQYYFGFDRFKYSTSRRYPDQCGQQPGRPAVCRRPARGLETRGG